MTDYVIVDGPGAPKFTTPTTLRSLMTLDQRVKLESLATTSPLARVVIAELDSPVTDVLFGALVELGVIDSSDTSEA